jgi:hypothetical protein
MADKQYERWLKAQKEEVKNFKPVVIKNVISNCPDCFGSLPQGNESAWAKGCHECDLFTRSDACSKATRRVHLRSLSKKEWTEIANRSKEFMSERAWKEEYGEGYKGV